MLASSQLALALLLPACRELPPPPDLDHPIQAPWTTTSDAHPEGAEAYSSCASCHLADGSGRPDGAIPRLAGQSAAVLAEKLRRIRDGRTRLPVMTPFARALSEREVDAVAAHLASLPTAASTAPAPVAEGRTLYVSACATCHGARGEGSDALLAPALCGQHGGYVLRRVVEILANTRGDADPAMVAVVAPLSQAQLGAVAAYLEACSLEVP